MPFRLMPVRNGYVNVAQRRMCGPSGAGDDVTSQQVCRRSTHRQPLRRTKGGLQYPPLLRVVEKRRSPISGGNGAAQEATKSGEGAGDAGRAYDKRKWS